MVPLGVAVSLVKGCLLKRFQEKWEPVFRPETRQINNLEPCSDSFEIGTALKCILNLL